MNAKLRRLLSETARLAVDAQTLSDTQDLYGAGLTSFSTVQVMLAIEEEFDLEFPERMLNRKTFASIASIEACIREIRGDKDEAAA